MIINTSNRSDERNTSFCIPEVYSGSVCRTQLQTLQTCLFGDEDGEIFIPANGNQEEAEQTAQTTIGGLPFLNPSEECSEIAPPCLCFSTFGLCNNQSRERYLPSSQAKSVGQSLKIYVLKSLLLLGLLLTPTNFPSVMSFQMCL